jgi:hypothetical protein
MNYLLKIIGAALYTPCFTVPCTTVWRWTAAWGG